MVLIEEWCHLDDLDRSLNIAQTLKVIESIVSEDKPAHTATSLASTAAGLSSGKRHAIQTKIEDALLKFTDQLAKSLKQNVQKDNCNELSKIITIYKQLDKLDLGVEKYITSVIGQFMGQFKPLD